jgi:M6 family metalloprotease-like protein
MRKHLRLVALVIPMVLVASNSHAAMKAGSSCSKAGIKSVSAGKTFTCMKSGKKLVWDKGVLIPIAKPAPGAADATSAGQATKPVAEIADPNISPKSVFADSSLCQLKSNIGREANLGYDVDSSYLNSTGNVNLAIIYTTYTDAAGDDRAFNEYEKNQFPNMAKFYSTASYGKLRISLTSIPKYYNINKSSASYNLMAMDQTSRFSDVVLDAVNAAKNDYDFSKVDGVLVVMPSSSKAVDLGATGVWIQVAGKTLQQGITAAFINPSTHAQVMPNFLVHEIGHIFGLPHPLAQDKGYLWNVMFWEIVPAPDLFGWEKFKLKWIEPVQVDCLASVPTSAITDYLEATSIASSNTKLTVLKLSDSKALVVESRRKSELDDLLPSEEGVLVYTVETNLGSNKGPIKLLSNGSPAHFHKETGNQLLVGTLRQGESVIAEGIKVTVLKHGKNGDFISISKS